MSAMKPSVEIELGEQRIMLRFGNKQAADFERMIGKNLVEAFNVSGIPQIPLVRFIIIGAKAGGTKLSEHQIYEAFDDHPEQKQKIVNEAVGYVIEKFYPSQDQIGDGGSDESPLAVVPGQGESTGTG